MFLKKLYLILLPAVLIMALPAFMVSRPSPKPLAKMPDCPTFDYSQMVVTKTTCNKSNGSIKGVVVTSTGTKITYVWHNQDGQIMGRSRDLLNIPAGTYVLEVFDNSGCSSLSLSQPIVVDDQNGINIDETNLVIKPASCSNDGSITGIQTTNTTVYSWFNMTTGTSVSNSNSSADVTNLAPGDYRLTLSNGRCDTSKIYTVPALFPLPQITSYKITNADCEGSGGSITMTFKLAANQPRMQIYLLDSFNEVAFQVIINQSTTNPVFTASVGADDYRLYVQDPAGCVIQLAKYTVAGGTLTFSGANIRNDRCDQHLGGVSPLIGGYKASRGDVFTWVDVKTGEIVGRNRELTNVPAGTYKITILTAAGCRANATYTVGNDSPPLVPPKALGSTICVPGVINITITNTDTSKLFKLYDSPTATTPIDSSRNGIFYRNVDQTTDFYVTRVGNVCESDRTKVTETVVASFKRPNAFTPNGDGINDFWKLEGVDKFPGADVKVFTRAGQQIYHSVNYATPFDGTYNGSNLPPGVYYYIIDLKVPLCYGKISGSLTIIR